MLQRGRNTRSLSASVRSPIKDSKEGNDEGIKDGLTQFMDSYQVNVGKGSEGGPGESFTATFRWIVPR